MSDAIEIKDNSSIHKYRTELPNILFMIGLDPFELALYCILKRTAGDQGQCTKSMKTLAAEVGFSESKLKEVKKSLCQDRPLLNNTPLITAYPRLTAAGDPDTDMVVINDIWPINFEYFKPKEKIGGGSPQNPGVGRHKTQGGSPGGPKEELSYEDLKEERKELPSFSHTDWGKKQALLDPLKFTSLTAIRSLEFTLKELEDALKAVEQYNPSGDYQGCLYKAIKGKWKPNQSKEMISQKSIDFHNEKVKPEDGKQLGIYTVSVGPDYVEFITIGNCGSPRFEVEQKDYEVAVTAFILKHKGKK